VQYYLTQVGLEFIKEARGFRWEGDSARGDQYGANIAWPGQPGYNITDEPPERGSTRARRWAKRLKKFRRVGSSPHTDPKDQKKTT